MAKSLAHIEDWLLLVFNNTNYANLGDGTGLRGSTSAGSLYLSLHTGTGTPGGWDQTTLEATYVNYTRIAVARTAGGWTVSTGETEMVVSNAADISFPEAGATSDETVYAVGVGTAVSGAGQLLYCVPLSPEKRIVEGVIPRIEAGNLTIREPSE